MLRHGAGRAQHGAGQMNGGKQSAQVRCEGPASQKAEPSLGQSTFGDGRLLLLPQGGALTGACTPAWAGRKGGLAACGLDCRSPRAKGSGRVDCRVTWTAWSLAAGCCRGLRGRRVSLEDWVSLLCSMTSMAKFPASRSAAQRRHPMGAPGSEGITQPRTTPNHAPPVGTAAARTVAVHALQVGGPAWPGEKALPFQ